MKQKIKDRLGNAALILFFFALIGVSAYLIFKIMIRWSVEGLG